MTRVVNIKNDDYDIYIGRGSRFGNPFIIGKDGNREDVIKKYEEWIKNKPEILADIPRLKGKILGCHCKPKPCHGDILVKLVEE